LLLFCNVLREKDKQDLNDKDSRYDGIQ